MGNKKISHMYTSVFGEGTPLRVLLYLCSGETRLIMPSLRLLAEQTGRGVVVLGAAAASAVELSINGKKVPYLPLDKVQQGEAELVLLCGMNYHASFSALSKELEKHVGVEVQKVFDFLRDVVKCAFRAEEYLGRSVIQHDGGILSADILKRKHVMFLALL